MAAPAERVFRYDMLRGLGMLLVILAHVNPPGWLFRLRNFDLVLLVLVAGATLGLSSKRRTAPLKFMGHRLARLLMPTWTFLCFFYLSVAAYCFLASHPFAFSLVTVRQSFELIGDYVWIVRVFLVIALATPLVMWLDDHCPSNWTYCMVIAGAYAAYEAAVWGVREFVSPAHRELVFTHLEAVAYACVFALGLRLERFDRRILGILACLFAAVFACLLFVHRMERPFAWVQSYKYPPTLYYLSYGFAVSIVVYLVSARPVFQRLTSSFVLFFGRYSLFVFLWHVFYLWLWTSLFHRDSEIRLFVFRYVFVTVLAALSTYIQLFLPDWLQKHLPVESQFYRAFAYAFPQRVAVPERARSEDPVA